MNEGGDELLRTNLEELIDVVATGITSDTAVRNKKMFYMRYRDRMTYAEIGEVYGCSGSNVRVITARIIRRLSHPSRSRVLLNDADEYQAIMQEQKERIQRVMDTIATSDDIIDVFRGNTRIYHALRRAGYRSLRSVHEAGKDAIRALRGIGDTALDVIVHEMDVRGYDVQSFIE